MIPAALEWLCDLQPSPYRFSMSVLSLRLSNANSFRIAVRVLSLIKRARLLSCSLWILFLSTIIGFPSLSFSQTSSKADVTRIAATLSDTLYRSHSWANFFLLSIASILDGVHSMLEGTYSLPLSGGILSTSLPLHRALLTLLAFLALLPFLAHLVDLVQQARAAVLLTVVPLVKNKIYFCCWYFVYENAAIIFISWALAASNVE